MQIMKGELGKIAVISKFTFIELYKSKIMMNAVLLGIGLVVLSYVASEFTYGVPQRVALDFGLGTLSLAAVGVAIFMGAGLISKEIENRTVYMILTRPLNRSSFLIGKIVGMSGILLLNILIIGILSIILFLMLGGVFSSLILWALLFAFLEALIILLVVIFFSLITNVTMAIIYSLSIFIVGHSISDTLLTNFVIERPAVTFIIKVYAFIFPNFSKFNIKDFVLYEQTMPSSYLFGSTTYAILYAVSLVLICITIFRYKNLD